MRKNHFVVGSAGLLLLSMGMGCASTSFLPEPSHGFFQRELPSASGPPHKFWVYRPKPSTQTVAPGASVPGQPTSPGEGKWPVILYLHGGGERGDDGVAQTQVGLGPVVQQMQGYFPFVVVFPQCPEKGFWALPDCAARAMAALEVGLAEFQGDPDRVYLTGNSMGGYGTWYLATRHPGRFAALAPICGGVKPPRWVPIPKQLQLIRLDGDVYAQVAEKVSKTPVWAFHGANDPLIPPAESRHMAAALKKNGGAVRLTVWPGVGHASEEPTYRTPELFDWFLQQKRGEPSADAGSDAPKLRVP